MKRIHKIVLFYRYITNRFVTYWLVVKLYLLEKIHRMVLLFQGCLYTRYTLYINIIVTGMHSFPLFFLWFIYQNVSNS